MTTPEEHDPTQEPATPEQAMVDREWAALSGHPYDPSATGQARRALALLAAILAAIAIVALILICA